MLLYVNVSTFLRRKLCCCSSSELILTCFFLPCFITAANSAGFWRNLPSATSNKQHENCDLRLLLKGQTSACPAHKRINSASCCFSKTNSARSYTKPKQTVSCFTNEKPREKRGKKDTFVTIYTTFNWATQVTQKLPRVSLMYEISFPFHLQA